MKRFISGLVVALGLASAGNAAAQEILITGPLAGAPAVRKERQYRKGRFELAPTVSFTLLDEYRRTIFVGAKIQYNFTEWLSFGVWGAYGAVSSTTSLTDEIDTSAPRNGFTAEPGEPRGLLRGPDRADELGGRAAARVHAVPREALALPEDLRRYRRVPPRRGSAFVGHLRSAGTAARSGPAGVHGSELLRARRADQVRAELRARTQLLPERLPVARRRVPRVPVLLEPRRVRFARGGEQRELPRR